MHRRRLGLVQATEGCGWQQSGNLRGQLPLSRVSASANQDAHPIERMRPSAGGTIYAASSWRREQRLGLSPGGAK
jgi:hypothetical protein